MKIKKVIRWFLYNFLYSSLAYLGLIGMTGAQNLFIFWVCINAIIYFLALVSLYSPNLTAKQKKDLKNSRSVPGWLSHGLDICLICALIWHGWWFTGIVILLSTFCEYLVYNKN